MEITYDPKYNIAYIRLRKKCKGVQTIHLSDEVNIDLSPDGKLYGIELLDASRQIIKSKKLFLRDASTGKSVEFPLTI